MIASFFTKHHWQFIKLFLMIIVFVCSYIFIANNAYMYHQPIAKITKTTDFNSNDEVVKNLKYDAYYHQVIEATLLNTERKGQNLKLESEYTLSKAYNDYYKVGGLYIFKTYRH